MDARISDVQLEVCARAHTHGGGGGKGGAGLCRMCVSIDGLHTKGTPACTHRELIREWLWEPKGSSLEHIKMLWGGVDAATLWPPYAPARRYS